MTSVYVLIVVAAALVTVDEFEKLHLAFTA